ncbi:hypothetical protein A2U01_0015001, partial [Trifolium medium]|nr:hypothetical protein [Trifolium medium]
MAPKKSTASDKKRKTEASTSQSSVFDTTKFIGPELAQRFKDLEKRTVWPEKIFDINDTGIFGRFVEIIESRHWGKLINPPKKINFELVKEFYANARPNGNERVSFVSMVRGREIRYDRDTINDYLGRPSDLPSDELCDFSKQLARGNWNVQAITETLLREGCTIEYNASGNVPLRALQNDLTIFSQLLLLLVLHNILPSSHTSDATMRVLGLMYYMEQDLQIDVARVISNEIKNMVLSGIRTTPLKPTC